MMISLREIHFPQFHCWHCSRLVVQFFPSCSCFILMSYCISFLSHSAWGFSSCSVNPAAAGILRTTELFQFDLWLFPSVLMGNRVSLYHPSTCVLSVCAVTLSFSVCAAETFKKHHKDQNLVNPALTKPK